MTTLVAFHAHPDDESIQTGGTIARAVAGGHRVVLVFATRGELGEVADGFLEEGEALGDRRSVETGVSAGLLGVERVEFLGYHDSGMVGEPSNDDPICFWQADVDEAAGRLAAILRDEDAHVLLAYDDHGGYGHPDHIQVHRVGHRAAQMAGTPHVLEATMNREHFIRLMAAVETPEDAEQNQEVVLEPTFGTAEADIDTVVDVRPHLDRKRASMRAHASQISEESFFLALPDQAFEAAFGTEWFRHVVGPDEDGDLGWLLARPR